MGFIKRIFISFTAIFLIFFSGSGVKSDNILVQGGAFIGLIVGLIFLYIFIKMAWRALGCLPAIFIIISLSFFIFYTIGAFSGGIESFSANIKNFLVGDVQTAEKQIVQENEKEKKDDKNKKEEEGILNLVEEDNHKIFTEELKESFSLKKNKQQETFNLMKQPSIYGKVQIISGDTFLIGNKVIKLFGVAAPHIKQTCANEKGRGYRCGQQSALWLNEWLSNNEIECRIVNTRKDGVIMGVCFYGSYDIGAAMVNAGMAVADTRQTQIYVPYQNQAAQNKRGLWFGEFYMPWDWEKIQNRKVDIKVISKKPKLFRKHTLFF